ncbi:hypothetical protein BDB01DRAFT_834910 [Pilobolus umbonatus]|nr:hypothetical protein BDB01DRAFT_834910 [Pilobolus umbonatus]
MYIAAIMAFLPCFYYLTMSIYSANSNRAYFSYHSPSPTPTQSTSPRYFASRSSTPVESEEEGVSYAHLFYDARSNDSRDTVPYNSGNYSAGHSNLVQGFNQGNNGSVSTRCEVGSESLEGEVLHEVVGPSVEGDNLLLNDYLNNLIVEQTQNEESYNEIPLYESHFDESEEIDVDDCMELDDPMDIDYPPLWWVVPMEIDNPMDID